MDSPRPRTILHADMDAFYASVEQRDHPELRGRPVIVGGSGGRGVVAAASYEARAFGVHSAMPSAQAKKLCPQAVFVSGSMKRYARESRRIFELFREWTPAVEGLSLDEAFLDLSGTERLHGSALDAGHALRERVRTETGLAVSVGIAPVKMVAKMASDLAKPDGLLEVEAGELRSFLDPLPVRRIWGVGAAAEARLLRAGFQTIGDLAKAEPAAVERVLGDWGRGLVRLARGEDTREVEPYRSAISYSEENTFAQDVRDRETLERTILSHAESVARRLRRDQRLARTVVLKWRPATKREGVARGGYPVMSRRTTLPEATDDGAEIARQARLLLDRGALDEPVRLVGVGVTNVQEGEDEQLGLFQAPREERVPAKLNRALDAIRDRFGTHAVERASQARVERAALSLVQKQGADEDDD